jgi:hypothetical protein
MPPQSLDHRNAEMPKWISMVIIPLGHISVHVTTLPHHHILFWGFQHQEPQILVIRMVKVSMPEMPNPWPLSPPKGVSHFMTSGHLMRGFPVLCLWDPRYAETQNPHLYYPSPRIRHAFATSRFSNPRAQTPCLQEF